MQIFIFKFRKDLNFYLSVLEPVACTLRHEMTHYFGITDIMHEFSICNIFMACHFRL